MNLRDLLNKHRYLGIAAAAVLLLLALRLMSAGADAQGRGRQDLAWFYDLQSGDLLGADRRLAPPLDLPGGGQAVRAVVFGCGGCGDEQTFIAYLESYDEAGRAAFEREPRAAEDEAAVDRGYRVAAAPAAPAAVTWHAADDAAAADLLAAPVTRCGERELVACRPRRATYP